MLNLNRNCRSPLAIGLIVAGCLFVARPPASGAEAPPVVNPQPIYLKQGDSIDVTFLGQNLATVASVALSDSPGMEAALVPAEKREAGSIKVKLSAAADAPLGEHELRLLSPTGVTAPVTIEIGQLSVAMEKEPNNSPEQATEVQLPAALSGKIDPAGDTDTYRFEAKTGQHLIFDVHALRIGSQLEPALAICDAMGNELVVQTEHHDGDLLLVFDPPSDGSYTLSIRDLQYRGGGDFHYRIDAGQIPYLESLSPGSGLRGRKTQVTAIGHNLAGAENLTLDLSSAESGPMPVRVKTALGLSNEVPFAVSRMTPATEQEPNNTPEQANPVNLPAEISAALDKPGDEDWFKFHVASPQTVTLEITARRQGSPVDGLLTLKNAKGDLLETNNGPGVSISAVGNTTPTLLPPVSADAEAKITRALEPGDYFVSVRDVAGSGGPAYFYRLTAATAGGIPQDFTVRFLPDAPRLHRGGNVKFWCDVERIAGFKGNVTVTLEGLPPGVTTQPVVLGDSTSGIFTVSAGADAPLGPVPISLKATATLGTQQAIRHATAILNSRPVRQAYLTVLEPAPFSIEAVALIKPADIQAYAAEVTGLARTLQTQTPQLDASQAEWEKHVSTTQAWTLLDIDSTTSAEGTVLVKQADGSLLASGPSPERDNYTIIAHTDVKEIVAIRLDVMPDPAFPGNGPGRAVNGNFVLNRFTLSSAPKSDPAKSQPVGFREANATFSQDGYAVAGAIDDDPSTGWALVPELGKQQSAAFITKTPIGDDAGTTLTFKLDQQYGEQHTIGRFRLWFATDPTVTLKETAGTPPQITEILKTPADKRTPEQKAAVASYFRTIAPDLAADRQRLESLRNGVGPYAEIARLETLANAGGSATAVNRVAWERGQQAGEGWTPLDLTNLRSSSGAIFTREEDGSTFVSGNDPITDVYQFDAMSPIANPTAIRIETLPDERLPENGPGRSPTGNFVLTRAQLAITPRGAAPSAQPMAIELYSPHATFEQTGWPAIGALDDRSETGWGIAPDTARPQSVIFAIRRPAADIPAGSTLRFTLDQLSPAPNHTIGRFRVWVTANQDPQTARVAPDEVREILRIADTARSNEQRAVVAAYYRTIEPSLEPIRDRLAELKTRVSPLPLTVSRNRNGTIAIPILRSGSFHGPIEFTLEGFSAGREPGSLLPSPIARNLTITPLTIGPDAAFGKLSFKATANAEPATRMVVIRGEAKVGNEKIIQYSPAFPLTVSEK